MKVFTLFAAAAIAGTAALGLASCERPAERFDANDDLAGDDYSVETPATTPSETRRPLGEGEREGMLTNAEIVDRFAREIGNDPVISEASNASLILTVNGELVLQGTAISDDVKDELEDYAEKLAGREVRNDIEVADK